MRNPFSFVLAFVLLLCGSALKGEVASDELSGISAYPADAIENVLPLGGIQPPVLIVPLGDSNAFFYLYSTNLTILSGYWRQIPNYTNPDAVNEWKYHESPARMETGHAGTFTISGSLYEDGRDAKNAQLHVVKVKEITVPSKSSKNNSDESLSDEIPVFFVAFGNSLTLIATPYPNVAWPVINVSDNETISYPLWSIEGDSSGSISNLSGASTVFASTARPGAYTITAECGNEKSAIIKVIRVKFVQDEVVMPWGLHDHHNVRQYLAGCAQDTCDPMTCEVADCAHYGVYDESNFGWQVMQGDAELCLQNGNTVKYAASFSVPEEAAKPKSERYYFTGLIRFTKSSDSATEAVIVKAISGDLASEFDQIRIVPPEGDPSGGSSNGTGDIILDDTDDDIIDDKNNDDHPIVKSASSSPNSMSWTFVPLNRNDSNNDGNVDAVIDTESSLQDDPEVTKVIIPYRAVTPNQPNVDISMSMPSTMRRWASKDRETASSFPSTTTCSPSAIPVFYVENIDPSWTITNSYIRASTANGTHDHYLLPLNLCFEFSIVDQERVYEGKTIEYDKMPGAEWDSGTYLECYIEGDLTKTKRLMSLPFQISGKNLQYSYEKQTESANRKVEVTFPPGKVEIYQQVDSYSGKKVMRKVSDGSGTYKFRIGDMTVSSGGIHTKALYLHFLGDSTSKRDIELTASYTVAGGFYSNDPNEESFVEPITVTASDTVRLTGPRLDVDVDSNNDGEISVDDEEEDWLEDTQAVKVFLNNQDLNSNGQIDYFDTSSPYEVFTEMKIRIPKSINPINYKLKFVYNAANFPHPGSMISTLKMIRIWKVQSTKTRTTADLIRSNTDYTMMNFDLKGREITLYIEGISHPLTNIWGDPITLPDVKIQVQLTPITTREYGETAPEMITIGDSVLVDPAPGAYIDLRIDSNNDGVINNADDAIEENSPGKIIAVNNGDTDYNGIPDFADGFDSYTEGSDVNKSKAFTPMLVRLGASSTAYDGSITFTYDASDPAGVTISGTGTDSDPYIATPAGGKLRIWTKDGTEARLKASVADSSTPGDYVPNGVSIPVDTLFGSDEITLYVEGIAASESAGDLEIKAILTDKNGVTTSDMVVVTVVQLDLNIDSNNDGSITDADDPIEENSPGKLISVNLSDTDGNGIPDFADGFDSYTGGSAANKSAAFTPMILKVKPSDLPSNAKIRFTYDASDPAGVTISGSGTGSDPYIATPASGNLRIWTKDGTEARLKASVAAASASGDYVPSGVDIPVNTLLGSGGNQITLYVEAIEASSSTGDLKIQAAFILNSVTHTDIVTATAVQIDLNIDSNNDGAITDADNFIEDNSPGKLIPVNLLDTDYNGIPDFADGFDSYTGGSDVNKSKAFTPMILKVKPSGLPSDITIKFTYDASDPAGVTISGTGTDSDPYIATPAGGKLRIWTKDGMEARLKASVSTAGDMPRTGDSKGYYVPAGTPIPTSKFFASGETEITLYVEAVDASSAAGDLKINGELVKNNNSLPASDTVTATAIKVNKVLPDTPPTGEEAIKIITKTDTAMEALVKTSTEAGGGTYSKYYTDAQTVDQKVTITAEIVPIMENITVYFEVIDPDDLSPYDGKTVVANKTDGDEDFRPNDNRDGGPVAAAPAGETPAQKLARLKAYYAGLQTKHLSATSASTDTNGKAEIELEITDRHSGDNYIVRAVTLNPGGEPFDKYSFDAPNAPASSPPSGGGPIPTGGIPFSAYASNTKIAQSAHLVAWKRAYIEHAEMYKKGATVTSAATNTSAQLVVDNVSDFSTTGANSQVEIFLPPDGTTRFTRTITATNTATNTITLNAAHGIAIPKYAGVKIQTENDVYVNSLSALPHSFGSKASGQDGCVFVEFKELNRHKEEAGVTVSGTNKLPKYSELADETIRTDFLNEWFINKSKINVMLLVAGKSAGTPFGVTLRNVRHLFIAFEKCVGVSPANVVSHESGHQWYLSRSNAPHFAHIDNSNAAGERWNFDHSDYCIMSYHRNRNNPTPKFCIECINYVREKKEF